MAVLLLPALLVAQMLFQLAPVAVASSVPVGAVVGSLGVSLNAGKPAGTYVGFNSDDTNVNPQNLSASGLTDWRLWGQSTTELAGDARKSGGTGISDLTNLDPAPSIDLRALGSLGLGVGAGPSKMPFSFGWNDGSVPETETAAKAGLQHNNGGSSVAPGYGFSFSVPAVAGTSHLKVWVSAHHGTGLLTATLTGVSPITDNSVAGGQNHGGVYTIDFTGNGTPGQTLTVKYELQSALDPTMVDPDGGGFNTEANVVIYAAALTAPAAPAPDFTIGAVPGALTIVQGTSDQSAIGTTQVNASGTVSLGAVVTGPESDVTATLTSSSIAAGSSTALTVAAGETATPGAYTVTVTGTEGSKTHDAVVNVVVLPSTGAPVLFRAVPAGATGVTLAGLLHGNPTTSYHVNVVTSNSCVDGVLGSPTTIASVVVTTDASGDSYFGGPIATSSAVKIYVAGQVVPPGAGSPIGPCIVASPDNDSWIRALDISGGSPLDSSGYIDAAGRGRWYKFTIQPGSRLNVSLSNLPTDYDLFLFKDIGKAYNLLTTTTSLTQLSAEFAPSAFSPSAFSPSAFSPSAFSPSAFSPSAFSPSAFSPSVFSPSAFSPSAFSPSAFSPSAFSPSAFSPSAFSPSAFSPSAFSPSAFSPSAFSAEAFSSAQTRSLIGISAGVGTGNESLVADTWTNTGSYYILVGGKNGASNLDQSFNVSVTVTGNTCNGVDNTGSAPVAPAPQSLKTLILEDSSRMPGGATNIAALQTKLATFAGRPEVGGAVVDLAGSTYSQVHALNTLADAHPDCVWAKNLVGDSIKSIVSGYRAANPGLKYIVIVGGDGVIPFFRYPDQSLLGPESDYVPPVLSSSASEASLRANYILGQDQYGAATDLSLGSIAFPVPDLAVGRLVESAADASGMIDAYLTTTGGVTTSTTSLVTGYDFLADAASSVQGDLNAGTGRTGDSLISPNNIAPTAGWTATQLKTALLGSRHDLIFLAGHFSANNALAADFTTTINSTDLAASPVNLTNSIVFSAGCHSGYNLVDQDAINGVTQPLDWVQAFAQKKATLIAGTGYQYGDTDFLEYSERIYAEFAHQLRIGPNPDGSGAVSVGQAFMRAKQLYLARTPDVRGLHQKALLEATLFGLPMLSVNMPAGRLTPLNSGSIVASTTPFTNDPGNALALRSADLTLNPTTTSHSVGLTKLAGGTLSATYYSGPEGVVTNPGEPALPLQSENVTVGGQVLRGVGFRGGAYTDSSVVPLTGAPNTEIRGVHTAFSSTSFFPMRPWTINYYDALGSSGGATRLLVTPAQHKVANIGDTNATLRLYSQLGFRLFYSNYTGASAKSAAPTISGVSADIAGSTVTLRGHVVGNPAAGIQQVWITWTGTESGPGGTWAPVDLVQDATDSTLWSGTLTLPSASDAARVRFMVQAVNGVGLVSLDDNLGSYYAPTSTSTTAPLATSLLLGASPATGVYGSEATVNATLTSGSGPVVGKTVVFTIGATTRTGLTGIDGKATTSIPLTSVPGSSQVIASFLGTAELAPSDDSHAFTITKSPTSIALAGPPTRFLGADSGIQATLTAGGTPLSFRTVFFVVSSGLVARTSAVMTDFAGRANLGVLPATVGAYTVTACFNGPASPASCSGTATADPTYGPAAASTTVSVIWPFTGFFSPVDNMPTVNSAKAGSNVPVKFSLGGNRGLTGIFATSYPKSFTVACSPTAVVDVIDEITGVTSALTYDASSNRYQFSWKTPKSLAGTCQRLDLKFSDGTTYSALFTFK